MRTKRWYMEHISDIYVKESKRLNYRSRAAFKLIQLDDKYKLFNGNTTLDLGAAPGSWSQVASNKGQLVTAIDLLDIAPIHNVKIYKTDIRDRKLKIDAFDTILSDMAPNFSGDHQADHYEISALNRITVELACKHLKPGGCIAMKTLIGPEEQENFDFFKQFFDKFSREKPLASKSESSELFYIGKGFTKKIIDDILKNRPLQINPKMRELILNISL